MKMNVQSLRDIVPATDDSVIDLGQIMSSLRIGWKTIGATTLTLMLLGFGYAHYLATPIFTAKSVVVLDTRKQQVVDLQGMMTGLTGESDELNTEVEVLRSRGLANKVVEELDLARDPEFNGVLRPPSLKSQVFSWLGAEDVVRNPETERDAVVSAFLETLSVRNVPASYVFEIAVKSENPGKAALIADTVARRYILNQIEVKFDATEQATAWLTNRVGELKTELEAAEEKLKVFNASTSLISEVTLTSLEAQLKDMRDRVAQVTEQEAMILARVAALKTATTTDARAEIAKDAVLNRLRDNPPAFDQRYAQVVARAELDAMRATDQREALQRSLKTLSEQASAQGDDMITLQQLTREAEASRTLYEYFLSRLKETSAQQGIQQADSRMLSQAIIPAFPTEPRKSLILAMCGILGLMAGVGLVLYREATRNGYRTARQLEEETGIVVMGQIPIIPGKARRDILSFMVSKPSSAAMEAVRNLRTSVLLSNVDKPPQVIISTSSVPSEGKTTNSLALALNLVGTGKSVLLIEGDIRRNTLAQYFPTDPGSKGLVSLLSGKASLDEVVVKNAAMGLSVLFGEKSSINAADLFMSESWKTFIIQMRERFDYVIIDTPPVLVVPDARIIAQSADAVLFTVRWNDTSRVQVQEALRMFETLRLKVSGLVLSQIDGAEMKRYGYGGKYGSYGAYSGYGGKYYSE